jgi:hypothetical protein
VSSDAELVVVLLKGLRRGVVNAFLCKESRIRGGGMFPMLLAEQMNNC